jgi:hypothetical protein
MNEFFRAGAGLKANINLVSQLAMGVALIGGGWSLDLLCLVR